MRTGNWKDIINAGWGVAQRFYRGDHGTGLGSTRQDGHPTYGRDRKGMNGGHERIWNGRGAYYLFYLLAHLPPLLSISLSRSRLALLFSLYL